MFVTELSSLSYSELSIPGGVLLESEIMSPLEQLRQRWENLNKDQNTKLQLSLNTLENDQLSSVRTAFSLRISVHVCVHHTASLSDFHFRTQVIHLSRLSSPSMVFSQEFGSRDSQSPLTLFEACSQRLERIAEVRIFFILIIYQ